MPTQYELASQMIQQFRLLDPSASAEVGTPERKIFDTVAQSLNDSQIDLAALSNSLDVDSKYGAGLDRFLAIFGFRRQVATFANGFATFSRTTASTSDIRIPASTTIQAPGILSSNDSTDVPFTTTYDVVLKAGDTSIIAPIAATIAGEVGNVATNRITEMIGSPILGITAVTNEIPTSSGKNAETDDEYKVRFKNTVFRNLAGTEDQYLALAISTAFTSRANVVGPQSLYREYVQVPSAADNVAYDINSDGTPDSGGGIAGEYTTALSTIPYAKYLWTSLPTFVSNGQSGVSATFYRQDVDFRANTVASTRGKGDAQRLYVAYLASTSPQANPTDTTIIAPNVTFLNVYTGANPSIGAVRPGDVVLLEFSYMSDASRNDLANNVTNAVDVYIDGSNPTFASTVTVRPTTSTSFVDNPTSKFHYENYRRVGDASKRPVIGNVLTPLYWQPVLVVPDQIIVGSTTYTKGVHYWTVEDTSSLGHTNRARSGIEWSTKAFGQTGVDSGTDPSGYTGNVITDTTGDPADGRPIEIDNYQYDKNIVDLQAALTGAKQITTDVLAHQAVSRFFKLDITVMYTPGVAIADVNNNIQLTVNAFLKSQFFGSAIQLSDLLQAVHNVSGVDNVRWSGDIPLPTGLPSSPLPRVIECTSDGRPLLGVTTERVQPGTATRPEIQEVYISGSPTAGQIKLGWSGQTTANVPYNTTAGSLQTAINALIGMSTTVVAEQTRSTTGVRYPLRSFSVTWASNGVRAPLTGALGTTPLSGGPFLINNDFFIRDNELAKLATDTYAGGSIPDTVPGLIIRPRAQGTWTRGI